MQSFVTQAHQPEAAFHKRPGLGRGQARAEAGFTELLEYEAFAGS